MKHPLPCLIVLGLATASLIAFPSCSSIKPDGVVDNVVSGNFFGGDAADDPPSNTNHVPPPPPPGGPVRWRLDF